MPDILSTQAATHGSVAAEMFEIKSWSDLVAAAPAELAAATGLGIHSVGGAICVVAPGIPSTEFNRSVGLGTTREAVPDDIAAILRLYRDRGVANHWVQVMRGATRPSDLDTWLANQGGSPVGRWVLLERYGPAPALPPTDLRIEEIGRRHAAEAGGVFCAGYGLPPAFGPWTAALVGRPNWQSYAAFDGERIVAVAFLFGLGDRAAMLGAATLPQARGRGAQSALLARRLRDAYSNGVVVAQSHTWMPEAGHTNPSLNNMRRSGLVETHQRINYRFG